jgi:hypothetical protein
MELDATGAGIGNRHRMRRLLAAMVFLALLAVATLVLIPVLAAIAAR